MYPYLKLIATLVKARFRGRLTPQQSNVIHCRVGLSDIDPFGELNHARYLNYMELGRWDYVVRSGFFGVMRKNGWGVAVGGASIRYRRRLAFLQKFTLTSEMLCHDGRWIYFLHEVHARGKICASALLKVCTTSKQGLVPVPIVAEAMGMPDWGTQIPDWVQAWIDAEGQRPWPGSESIQ